MVTVLLHTFDVYVPPKLLPSPVQKSDEVPLALRFPIRVLLVKNICTKIGFIASITDNVCTTSGQEQ